tara:strand:- start:275 stop:421 length:147 start_codon:yes stop_codon:yes gene_type:complete
VFYWAEEADIGECEEIFEGYDEASGGNRDAEVDVFVEQQVYEYGAIGV